MTGDRERGVDIADGAMLAVALIWSANNVVVKAVLDEVTPFAYVVARFVIVVVLLFAWLLLWRRLTIPRWQDLPLFALAGIFGYAVYNTLFTFGLDQSSAFSVALLLSLGPVFTMMIAALLGIERAGLGQWVGASVAMVGVAVFVSDKLQAGLPTRGDLLTLIAAAAFAIYSLATGPIVGRYGAPTATAWSALIGLLVVAPVAMPDAVHQPWRDLSGGAWLSLVYASAISMLLAFSIWAWAIARQGVGRTVPYLFLIPVVTGILAALFLGEQFGLLKISGGLLVLLGTALVRLQGRRPPKVRGQKSEFRGNAEDGRGPGGPFPTNAVW